jgi:hypothetical protein
VRPPPRRYPHHLKEYAVVVLKSGFTQADDGTVHDEYWIGTSLRAANVQVVESGALVFIDSAGEVTTAIAPARWKEINRTR